jgi:hypothetical protein
VSEWLDLMLEEIARKRREQDEALAELERRSQADDDAAETVEERIPQAR